MTATELFAGIAGLALLLIKLKHSYSSLETKYQGKQYTVRKSTQAEDWLPALPTLTREEMCKRLLFQEPGTGRFALELRLGPNQHYPAHVHGSNEWIFVLEGEISDQFSTKHAGDFFYNEKYSLHYAIKSGNTGCLLLVVKDLGDNPALPSLDCAC